MANHAAETEKAWGCGYRGYTTQEYHLHINSRRIRRNPGTPSSPLKQDLHGSLQCIRETLLYYILTLFELRTVRSSLVSRPSVRAEQQPPNSRPSAPIWCAFVIVAVKGTRSRFCACVSFSGVMANNEVVRCRV